MRKSPFVTMAVRVPKEMRKAVADEARRRMLSASDVVRERLSIFLSQNIAIAIQEKSGGSSL